jgi:hypothetical protein
MAKKKVAQEPCLFCGSFPCACKVESLSKLLRDKHGRTDEEPTEAESEA